MKSFSTIFLMALTSFIAGSLAASCGSTCYSKADCAGSTCGDCTSYGPGYHGTCYQADAAVV
ncbi:hypothetical protein CLAFUW4_02272 [Fulvia fulva]|uniref:Putative effector 46 n=1 Tax=Passalora fulva TaxID=5499 RepID=A0A1P8YXL2_PASFU|nr:uncharacterized protein CLAFUR5_14656 [Fulvia fulva]AQA29249.1 putative effector 46 [Fulvia fulva]KAK4634141.1 hypothetical protein CLAFUR4_02267 [Fulvia fulva]KAK4637730.1 hypothetical protein CLAFUR0_02271 [Fulvia fulva]UJO11319.1 hypothetical protein CLAFUR5_14656 [Fulvia fulva]WPV09278.1 hypothetical protein CLAFUW4_02272 [Fulvia fulva]